MCWNSSLVKHYVAGHTSTTTPTSTISLWLIGVICACCLGFIVALLFGCELILVLIRKKEVLSAANNNTKCDFILATDTNVSCGFVNDNCKCKDNVAYRTVKGSIVEVIGP